MLDLVLGGQSKYKFSNLLLIFSCFNHVFFSSEFLNNNINRKITKQMEVVALILLWRLPKYSAFQAIWWTYYSARDNLVTTIYPQLSYKLMDDSSVQDTSYSSKNHKIIQTKLWYDQCWVPDFPQRNMNVKSAGKPNPFRPINVQYVRLNWL